MKKLGIWKVLAGIVLALGVQVAAFAHTHLGSSSPANGETVSSPSVLMLTFGDAVRLVRVSVAGSAGDLDIGFSPVADAGTNFHLPMPFMAAGAYTVNWTAIGADGHSVSDSFNFTVDPNAPAAVMNHDAEHGHEEAHSHDDHSH